MSRISQTSGEQTDAGRADGRSYRWTDHIGFIQGQFTKEPVDAPNNVFVHESQLKTMGGISPGSFASVVGNLCQGKAIMVTHLGLRRRNTDGMTKFFQFGRVEASQT